MTAGAPSGPTARQLFDELMSAYLDAGDHARGWAALVDRTSSLLDELGTMPQAVEGTVERLRSQWAAGTPDAAELLRGKVDLWHFLSDKQGTTLTIADAEDRSVRAALTLAEPDCPPEAVSDSAAWVADMLSADPWPSATSMF